MNMTVGKGMIAAAILCAFSLSAWLAPAQAAPEVGSDPAWQVEDGWFRSGGDLAQQAEQQFQANDYRAAARTYGRMANLASRRVNAAWATMNMAEMEIAGGRLRQAAAAYKSAIEKWPAEINFSQAVERLREIAEAYVEQPGTVLFVLPVGRTRQAIEIYKFILEQAPAGPRAAGDRMRLAQLYRQDNRDDEAMQSFREVFQRHPQSEVAPQARIEYIKMILAQAGRQHDNPALLESARREARLFLRFHPEHELAKQAEATIAEVDDRLANHYLGLAEFYLHPTHLNPSAANRYLQQAIEQAPESPAARAARQRQRQLSAAETEDAARPDQPVTTLPPTPERPTPTPTRPHPPSPETAPSYSVEAMREMDVMEKRLLPMELVGLPPFSSLAVASLRNPTREANLGTVLLGQLNEQIMREETVRLENRNAADLLLEIRIDEFNYRASASARVRDEKDIPDAINTYSTTLYTAILNLQYRVVSPAGETLMDWRSASGQADFPGMPDMGMARDTAIEQAATDAAGKIVHEIVEAW